MSSLRSIVWVTCIALFATCCGGSADNTSSQLDGREFWSLDVIEAGVPRPLAPDTRISLRFDGERVIAHAGCNSMQGTYSVSDGQLRTTELSMTEMGCDPQRHAQDEFVAQALAASPQLTIEGMSLRLVTSSANLTFVDTVVANPPRPLVDTLWEVDGFIAGDAATSFSVDERASLMIGTDSTLTVFGMCEPLVFPVEVAGGDDVNEGVLRFGPRAFPEDSDCQDSEYRGAIYSVFETGEATYSISGTNLTLETSTCAGMTLRSLE